MDAAKALVVGGEVVVAEGEVNSELTIVIMNKIYWGEVLLILNNIYIYIYI